MRDGAVARDVSRERRVDLPGARLRHEPIVAPSCILNEVNGADPKRRPDPTRRRVLAAAGVAALTMFAFACAGIIGIDDRLPDDVTDEGGAGIDRFVPDDVVVPPGACPATAKCVVAPDGWVLTSLDPNNRTGCADGYGSPEDVLVTADGLGCTCKCTETSPGSCVGVAGQTTPFRSYPAAGCGNNSQKLLLGKWSQSTSPDLAGNGLTITFLPSGEFQLSSTISAADWNARTSPAVGWNSCGSAFGSDRIVVTVTHWPPPCHLSR